ncbi:MAG: ABC transporter permease [Planctomycetes bacterium]|nr:ABC transporter permease [Planctomycetota bacterium]
MNILKAIDETLNWIDRKTNRFFSHFSSVTDFGFDLLYWSTFGWFRRKSFPRREIFKQISTTGVDTLPIIGMVAFLVGLTLVLQSIFVLERSGQEDLVGGIVAISMTRELGPLITAIIFSGRVGAAYTAELGTMKISEEILALETMAINPIAYLGAPRLMSAILVMPALTIFANFIGMFAAFLIATVFYGISDIGFNFVIKEFLRDRDLWFGVWKSFAFGIIIVVISCYKGFTVEGGGEQVGRATMESVVLCLVTIIFADSMFSLIYNIM